MEFKHTVCEAFRVLRKIRNMTQRQVILESGCCSIGNIENGRSLPGIEGFVNLCRCYDVNAGRLLSLIELSLEADMQIKVLIEKEWGE